MKILCYIALSILVLQTAAQTTVSGSLRYQKRDRTYLIHLPTGYNAAKQYPLYIALHGNSGTSKNMMDYTGLNVIADTGRFLVVYPQGISNSWADGRGTTDASKMGIDDVGFMARLIDTLVNKYNANPNKVYAAGISNGGFMTQTLLCNLSNKIAAGASIAAEVIDSVPGLCASACKKPVLLFHGTKDTYIPYTGGAINGQNGGNGKDGYCLSADSSFAVWAARNGCIGIIQTVDLPNINTNDKCTVSKKMYADCKGQNQVVLYTIKNGGHTWPGSKPGFAVNLLLGNTNQDINAGVESWNFFKTKTLKPCNLPINFSRNDNLNMDW